MHRVLEELLNGKKEVEFEILNVHFVATRKNDVEVEIHEKTKNKLYLAGVIHLDTKTINIDGFYRNLTSSIGLSPSLREFVNKKIAIGNTTVEIYIPPSRILNGYCSYSATLKTKPCILAKIVPSFEPLNERGEVEVTFDRLDCEAVREFLKKKYESEEDLARGFFDMVNTPPERVIEYRIRKGHILGTLKKKRITITHDGNALYVYDTRKKILTVPNGNLTVPLEVLDLLPYLKSKVKIC